MLSEAEQKLFARLSVFTGGCTLESAYAVCGTEEDLGIDVLDGITSLVEKSLLRQEEVGEPRFLMLETTREYATERLEASGEAGEIRRRQAETYLALAEEAGQVLSGPQQIEWLERLEREHDNLRAVLTWLQATNETDRTLRLVSALSHLWTIHGHLTEGRRWLEAALAAGGTDSSARVAALTGLGGILRFQGDWRGAQRCYQEVLALARETGDRRRVAGCLQELGIVQLNVGDGRRAHALLEESLAVSRELAEAGCGRPAQLAGNRRRGPRRLPASDRSPERKPGVPPET